MNQRTLQCFRDYVTLKLHFNGEFIWNRTSGERITASALQKRKDFVFFDKMAYQIKDQEERRDYFITCFLKDQKMWIGEMLEQDIKHAHRARMMKVNSLEYTFTSEVENLIEYMREKGLSIKELLLTNNATPLIMADQRNIIGGVSFETMSLLDKGFRFTSQKTDDPLWRQTAFVLSKYRHFLEIPKEVLLNQLNQLASVEA